MRAHRKSRGDGGSSKKDSAERTRWFVLSDTFLSLYQRREEFEARGTAQPNSFPFARYELRGAELTPVCDPARARFIVQVLIPLDAETLAARAAAKSRKSPEQRDALDACPMDRLIVRFESVRSSFCSSTRAEQLKCSSL